MNKKKLIITICITIILLITTLIIAYFINKDNDIKQEEVEEVKKIDQMSNYDYYLEETSTEY